ncbi:MAG: hypothetical protein AAFV43_08560 [Planctomycetota bacterium]
MATVETPPNAVAGISLWNRIDDALAAISDRLNPILIREARQALKSRQFTLWFVLLLVACWITTIGGVALVGPSIYYISAGGILLRAYYAVLLLPLTVIIPFSAYRSLAAEQEENTRDLLEVSTLSHWQIVNGKLGSAAMQMAMYLAALAPCIAFTYLLRGVDLVTIVLLLVYAVLACLGLSAVGLLLAASQRQKRGQNFLSVLFAGALFFTYSSLFGVAMGVMSLDPTDRGAEWFFWVHAGAASVYFTSVAVIYVAAAGLCTFASANRSTPLRVAIVAQQAVAVAWIAGLLAIDERVDRGTMYVAFATVAVYWFGVGAVLTGEPAQLSQRVRRKLPDSLLGRSLLSWFYPGPGSGYVFAVANLTLLLGLYAYAVIERSSGGGLPTNAALLAGVLTYVYVVGFLGAGRLLISVLRRFATLTLLGAFLVQFLLVLACSAIPPLVLALGGRARLANSTLVQVFSPAQSLSTLVDGDFTGSQLTLICTVALALAGCSLLINLSLAGREAGARRLAKPQRVLEDEAMNATPVRQEPRNPWGDLPDTAGLPE